MNRLPENSGEKSLYDVKTIKEELIRDEGLRLKPYKDTVGKLTIGIGRNIDDVGISEDEAIVLLENDISSVINDLDRNIPWWRTLSPVRQRAIINMCFNLGWPRLSQFKRMLGALQESNYEVAACEALKSKWYRQVGIRARRIAEQIKFG